MPYNELLHGRYSEPGRIYLVTTVTKGRRPVFTELAHALPVIRNLQFAHEQQWVRNIAWVLMPDHLLWLFALGEEVSLARALQRGKGKSAYELNRAVGAGSLWQRGYHEHALRREEDLRETARYVITNPVRAGLVDHVGDYPYWDAMWL